MSLLIHQSFSIHLSRRFRLWVGLGCTPDRHKAHKYLVHAALSPLASQFDRATAHGVLTSWYIPEGAQLMRPRDAIACANHANESAILSRKVSPPGARESPYVLRFVKRSVLPHGRGAAAHPPYVQRRYEGVG